MADISLIGGVGNAEQIFERLALPPSAPSPHLVPARWVEWWPAARQQAESTWMSLSHRCWKGRDKPPDPSRQVQAIDALDSCWNCYESQSGNIHLHASQRRKSGCLDYPRVLYADSSLCLELAVPCAETAPNCKSQRIAIRWVSGLTGLLEPARCREKCAGARTEARLSCHAPASLCRMHA